MNASRRRAIKRAVEKYMSTMTEAREALVDELNNVIDDEQDAMENVEDFFPDSPKVEEMQECIDAIKDVVSDIEDDEYDFSDMLEVCQVEVD